MPVFYRSGKIARIFPLHLPSVLERRRFWGGVSELEGHLPVLSGILWSNGCSGGCVSAWGGHLHVLDDQAALWQRCLSLISSCTMPSITSPVTSFWYRSDTKQPVSMLFGMKSSVFLHCLC